MYCPPHRPLRLDRRTGRSAYGRLMKEKVYRLVLPYVVLSSLAYVIKASLGHVASRPLEFTWKAYVHPLLYPWVTPSSSCGFCRPYSSSS
jgi:hypothetical protein